VLDWRDLQVLEVEAGLVAVAVMASNAMATEELVASRRSMRARPAENRHHDGRHEPPA
jgi:hypothetical protein